MSTINKDQIMDESNCSETEVLDEIKEEEEDEDLQKLLVPDVQNLPITPPSAVESNFATFFAIDFMKPAHDQYVYRHANGLCVIGLAPSHVAFKDEGGITAVDFNVGKSDRSEMKVTGKRKKNAQHFESNTALCKISTKNDTYIVRCCVKGSLLEVNQQLIKQPELLNVSKTVRNLLQKWLDDYIILSTPRETKNLMILELLCEEFGFSAGFFFTVLVLCLQNSAMDTDFDI
ncbi:hypothetical protein VIGAN_01500200 [Vigna angularis var. angularis]|uniref:Protein Abitram n=1 Tax=Vigna angularis var. angularis TaxID=157739 RepID=A0A0S3R8W8_PHAAN|nr:uncharacterized protein LOC108334215 isoform X1 [Vigna angularis]BAT76929.1 hypothetical protein VIGAN_01500200 [Vigna angularis var. angularis]